VIVGFLLVFASSFILNRILYKHNIVHKNTSLAGFIFMIMMSYYPEYQVIRPVSIAVFVLLLIIDQLLKSYNREESLDLIYSSGFLTAIGSFIYFPFIFFYGLILVSFIFFRSVNWREWVSSFFGFATPFLFLATYYFWFDRLIPKIHEYIAMYKVNPDLVTITKPAYIVLTSLIILLSLFSVYYSVTNRIEKTIERKRKNLLLNWVIFFVLASFPFTAGQSGDHIELVFITFAGSVAYYLMQIRKSSWQEIVLLLFILFLLLNNIFFQWS
jgi:hypothetical protein